jgi:multiple sugar transport system permease protein
MRPSRGYLIFIHVAAAGVGGIILAPFLWLLFSSLISSRELVEVPLDWWPDSFTITRYRDIFSAEGTNVASEFRVAMKNSLIVATSTTAISLVVGTLGGYAFARLRFRFRKMTLKLFLVVYMLPPIALVIPLYLLMAAFELLDTKIGLIVTYCSLVTPFAMWTMSNYFLSLPEELEDAARVDGCSRLGALFRIVLPMAKPGVFATALFAFLLAWDEFLYSLIFTSTTNSKTIPVAIAEFTGKYGTDFGLVAAGGVLASLPPVLLAIAFQRYIVGGLSSGSVKG